MQHIIDLIYENRISDAFFELDKLGIKSNQYAKLKQEFIYGDTRFDFHERLKVLVQNLPQETFNKPESQNQNTNPTTNLQADALKELLAKDKIEQALKELQKICKDTDNENVIIMQSARWSSLNFEATLGTITQEDVNVQKACLYKSLLKLIDEIFE
jgi:uncharacterized protein YdiU (UPF0061 family)